MPSPRKCPNCYGAGYVAAKIDGMIVNNPCPICSETGWVDQNSMKQANENFDKWRDARDVDKAFDQFVKDMIIWWNGLTPNRLKAVVKDMKAFAKFYAQRCGVVLDSECEHPYHSVVGGGGKPERFLKCGKVLSD